MRITEREANRQRIKNFLLCKMYATDDEVSEIVPAAITIAFVAFVIWMVVVYFE